MPSSVAQSRAERARQMLAHASAVRESREAKSTLRCKECGRVLVKFEPPIGRLTLPCWRCGTWMDFTTNEQQ